MFNFVQNEMNWISCKSNEEEGEYYDVDDDKKPCQPLFVNAQTKS